jgi:hypothetical protein
MTPTSPLADSKFGRRLPPACAQCYTSLDSGRRDPWIVARFAGLIRFQPLPGASILRALDAPFRCQHGQLDCQNSPRSVGVVRAIAGSDHWALGLDAKMTADLSKQQHAVRGRGMNDVTENSIPKQHGRPFTPGVSGNPKGKPKGARNHGQATPRKS